jgi:phosphate transport system permease protein
VNRRALLEGAFRAAVTAAGYASGGCVLLILVFLAIESAGPPLPVVDAPRYGLLPLATGSLVVSAGALLLAVPLGIAAATFLAEVAPRLLREVLKPTIELFAAIPSVVIGFVGIAVVAPAIKETLGLPVGLTASTCAIILAIMALPTIVTIAEDALSAVPATYRDASLALGANRWQTTWRVVIPAAAPGFLAAVILGAGRVLGETMAVLMVTGNAEALALDPRSQVRTIAATIAAEMGKTTHGSSQYHALFALAAVLYLVTFAVNGLAAVVLERARGRLGGAP